LRGGQGLATNPRRRDNLPTQQCRCVILYDKRSAMSDSVYKVIELVGTSSESWEKAAAHAVETAAKSLRDLRIAEITTLDMQIDDGRVVLYRAKVKISFKYHQEED